ncbi:MAG: CPBP family intramembrane glutamic endopeptidase [Terriglobia bacterium]|jgi:hypothetical protein
MKHPDAEKKVVPGMALPTSHMPAATYGRVFLVIALLTLLVIPAEAIILAQTYFNPWRLAAFLECLSLTLAAVVALTDSHVVRELRRRAMESATVALALPFLLLVPYLILAIGTGTFRLWAAGKLALYIAAPTLLLLPDRLHRADHSHGAGWRDFAAMAALAVPVGAQWLDGIWIWPQEVYFFRPLFCVCVCAYDFLVIRGLEDSGFRLIPRKGDLGDGLANLVAFSLLGIPLGIYIGFIHPHWPSASGWEIAFQCFGIYLTIAIPEELMFRGILQNFLAKTIPSSRAVYGLVIASVIFGAAHLHHPPVPNWRYGIMATLAGLFYGNAWRTRHRLPASALTHAMVDTMWRFWF